jgi:hypothetical protein
MVTSRRSTTFQRLVHVIEATDGIVYVERGQCVHGVRACLTFSTTQADKFRVLRILVDPRQPDWDVMALIGHELQHAIYHVERLRGILDTPRGCQKRTNSRRSSIANSSLIVPTQRRSSCPM